MQAKTEESRLGQKENQIQMLTTELESTKRRLKQKATTYEKFRKGLAKEIEELLKWLFLAS